ncbi:hypothetical protein GOBAR_AA39816 [Gossypium barbadense]|uniref:Formin-like protein n=1 Tax=Gossypium barbadense TaxID=3634 RepID=A0A2P5VQ50_GOSBA|nr:hypothetical protein GOBAR_AA39816 [Gossypium barbadense]
MALFRRFFYRKPPDRLLEISERVYVFDCCFSVDVLEEDEYKVYMGRIVAQLQDYFPDASFMVFNFREGERRSLISDILSQYDMTVMDYPRQHGGCQLLPLEMIRHFLRSSESWLSLEGQQNVLLMHCERGGWPVLAFMLAGLLLYQKQYNGEKKTLEMVYTQAPRELLQLLSPLNPQPSQLRYLQYISRRNLGSDWPPSDTPLFLDCLILRVIPTFGGEEGCRPVARVYGQDPKTPATRSSKLLFSTLKEKNQVRHFLKEECILVKMDIHCRVQGDVVLECIHLNEDLVREELIFRVMFHTAFVQANILMLNRDEIDVLWDGKDQFPKDFRAEELNAYFYLYQVLFTDPDAVVPDLLEVMESEDGNEIESAAPEEIFEVEEIFSNAVNALEGKVDDNSLIVLDKKVKQKEVWRENVDPSKFQDCASNDGNYKQDVKVDFSMDAVKDIAVDDANYNLDKRMVSDINAVKDIAVDDGDIKVEPVAFTVDVLRVREATEVTEGVLGKLEEMEDKGNRKDCVQLKNSESKMLHQRLKSDVSKPKPERTLPASKKHAGMGPKPALDSLLVKSKSKQQEAQGPPVRQAKPNVISRWIPPNKGSYTISMHVSYPPSRYNSASVALLSNSVALKDSYSSANQKGSNGVSISKDVSSKPKSVKADHVELSNSPKEISSVPIILTSPPLPQQSAPIPPSPPPPFSPSSAPPPPPPLPPTSTLRLFPFNLMWAELETLFSAVVPKPAGSVNRSGVRRKSVGSKPDKVHLIDLRRANNTEIMLTKVKMPLSDMMIHVFSQAAVLAMDDVVLDVDQVENLIKFCPTKEEMELLKGYTGDKESLGKCEQYFLELMKVPRVESKLRVFSFKIQFGSQISEFKKSLSTVNSACDEVRNSLKLKEIMKKILYLGNTLNQGTARGSAVGFKLDSLLKLTDTRASNSKMTLMHYLCKVLAAKKPALLDFHQEFVSLEAATKIQLKSLAEEMQAITKGLEKVKQELAASENDGPVSEVFWGTLKGFLSVAEGEVTSVTNLYSVVGRNADALALYFGEDPARCPFEQVTATLLNFVRLFRKAHEENMKQVDLEKKKAEKEKAKGINLTKKGAN